MQFVVLDVHVMQTDEHDVQVPLMGIMDMLGHVFWHVPLVSTRLLAHEVQVFVLFMQLRHVVLHASHTLVVELAIVVPLGHDMPHALLNR